MVVSGTWCQNAGRMHFLRGNLRCIRDNSHDTLLQSTLSTPLSSTPLRYPWMISPKSPGVSLLSNFMAGQPNMLTTSGHIQVLQTTSQQMIPGRNTAAMIAARKQEPFQTARNYLR